MDQKKSQQYWISERSPQYFKDNFYKDQKLFYDDLVQGMKKMEEHSNYSDYFYQISLQIEFCQTVNILKILMIIVYGIPIEKREFIVSNLFSILFNNPNMNFKDKVNHMRNILYLSPSAVNLKNMKLDHKPFIDLIEEYFFTNKVIHKTSQQQQETMYKVLTKLLVTHKKYFSEQVNIDVIQIFRENFNPEDSGKAFYFLVNFLKISKKIDKSHYQEIFDEIMQIWHIPQGRKQELFLFYFLISFSKNHKDLPWEKYHQQIFSYILRIVQSNLPGQKPNNKLKEMKQQKLFQMTPTLIVNLLVGSKNEHFHTIWQNVERIFNLMQNFIHPQNETSSSAIIKKFYKNFCNAYMRRLKQQKYSVIKIYYNYLQLN